MAGPLLIYYVQYTGTQGLLSSTVGRIGRVKVRVFYLGLLVR